MTLFRNLTKIVAALLAIASLCGPALAACPDGVGQIDSDQDGLADTIEGDYDEDHDGLGNRLDTDSDNDGLSDREEYGLTAQYSATDDADQDGLPYWIDADDTNSGNFFVRRSPGVFRLR